MSEDRNTMPDNNTDATTPDAAEQNEQANPNAEAAKYRRQLRDTELERDQIGAQLEASRRALVDHIASTNQITTDAFWAAGTDLADLLDDDGMVDPGKVADVADSVRRRFNIPRAPKPNPMQGQHSEPKPASWSDLLSK